MSDRLPVTPSFGLGGKRALITGAGRGLGLAAAVALADAGAQVTLVARSNDEITSVAQAIRRRGGVADTIALDVTDIEMFAKATADAEPFQIFVNNAGINRPQAFVDVTAENFDAIMNLNVRAAFFAAQAVARRLVGADLPGSIINVSSQMGLVGAQRRSVYCASKWAMEGFTKSMAIELAPSQIRVNTICPTFIETPMVKSFLDNPEFKAEVLGKIKFGRLGTQEEIMGAIVFLASDASTLMTGSSLVADGGWTAD
jgi:NAD(P)-dependent dehydrogenase (short-subunit alcohol dehydrogenase family)